MALLIENLYAFWRLGGWGGGGGGGNRYVLSVMDKFNANFPYYKFFLSFEVCWMKMQVIVVRLKDHSQGYM